MQPRPDIVHLAAAEIPSQDGLAPEWLHLLPPPGRPFGPSDGSGRGPWHYPDAAELIAASFAQPGPRLFVDIDHATLRAAPNGGEAPAIGEIVEMEARADGLWGRVQWSRRGAELMADRAFRAVSPVLLSDKRSGRVQSIWHVSVTNNPALRGSIQSLTAEDPAMSGKIAKALGLPEDASEDDVLAAIAQLMNGAESAENPVEMSAVATALGAEPGATQAELVVLAKSLRETAQGAPDLVALQSEIGALRSERWVEQQIAAGAGIGAAIRDDVMALHAQDPERAARLVAGLPKLSPTHAGGTPPARGAQVDALSADQKTMARQLGLSQAEFLAQLAADAEHEEAR